MSDEATVREPANAVSANPGAVTLHESLSQTDVTFTVESTEGERLTGQVVRLVSDGEQYDVLTYDPTGAHVPALYFGSLREPTALQAWQRLFGPRPAHAFSAFALTLRVETVEPGSVVFAPLFSAGHFQFAGLAEGPAVSVCAPRDAFEVSPEVMEALATTRVGMIITPNALTAWAFHDIPVPSAVQALTERLYEGLEPQTSHTVTILTTEDERFKFLFATAEVCEQSTAFAFTASADTAGHDTACAMAIDDHDNSGDASVEEQRCTDLSVVSLTTTAD